MVHISEDAIEIGARTLHGQDWNVAPVAVQNECRARAKAVLTAVVEGQNTKPVFVGHDPGNYLAQIDSVWAVLSVDEGGEGVCAIPVHSVTMPMITPDEKRLNDFIPIARVMAKAFKKTVRLVRFHQREVLEVFEP